MIHSAFDPMDIAGLHQWMQQQAGDNSQRRQRLLHNLSRAMTEELPSRRHSPCAAPCSFLFLLSLPS